MLIVDDERGPREALQLILKPYFRVFTADGGERAMEVIRNEPVDVVTLDLKMTPLSGPETLAQIREVDPDIEVVVVTGYGSFESAIDVLRLRAFDYISKPFESSRILDVVRKAAEARRHHLTELEVEEVVPPLTEIVDDVEHWRRSASTRLAARDQVSLDRIVERLRALRAHVYERLKALRPPGHKPTENE
ncbi:MAG: response regulator [Candidatus Binatia bacterium]